MLLYFNYAKVLFLVIAIEVLEQQFTCSTKVVIIGSGIAGLSAAYTLINNNITDIIILEAKNRVGGRTYTFPLKNGFIEYGAQWIHGSTNNPIYDFCESINIVDEDTLTEVGDMYYASQDSTIIKESKVDSYRKSMEVIYKNLANIADKLETDRSVGSILDQEYKTFASKYAAGHGLSANDKEILNTVYEARLKDERVNMACQNLYDLSALGWNAFKTSGGEDLINLKNGYGELVDYFRKKIQKSRIILNSHVTKIIYSRNDVIITAMNTITKQKTNYTADYSLVTASLGYLKHHYKTMFSPSLPTRKQKAIKNLGFGTINKFFLIYNHSIFDENVLGMQVLWKQNLNIKLQSVKNCNITKEFYKNFGAFELLPKQKNILYGFTYGDMATYTESLSDQCIIDVITELLKKTFPKLSIPKPQELLRSKWSTDIYTFGSYSYIPLGSSIDDIKALAETVNGNLFFAGEATSSSFYTTVHGAYESGVKAAKKIKLKIH